MKEKALNSNPLARTEGLVIKELADEVLVYDLERDQAHCLNHTAADVWRDCNGRNSTTKIAQALGNKLNHPVDEKIVWLTLDQLGSKHLLDVRPTPPSAMTGIDRRTMMRSLGLAATLALPLISSIVAPTPVEAGTCTAAGGSCTSGSTCCSGSCVGLVCQ